MLLPVILGAVLGGGLAVLASRHPERAVTRPLAIGLGVAALVYVLFAAFGGGARWLAVEAGGLAVFAGIGWLGRRAPVWLALGWTAHVAWDIGVHGETAGFVPAWYPLLCVGFDLVVAGYALGLALRGPGRR